MTWRILVCDDERALREGLAAVLSDAGYDVEVAADGEAAVEYFTEVIFDAMLLDLKLPGIDGLETLRRVLEFAPDCAVVMITAHASVDSAVEALKLGAYDYLRKPLVFSDVLARLQTLLRHRSVVQENRLLRRELAQVCSGSGEIVANAPAMSKVLDLVRRAAATPSRLLITGESGAGKEVVARAVHELSPHRQAPFVAVNMAALPDTLLEAQLFGHVRGAFTGAGAPAEGLVRSAQGGTLLLDEVGEMSLPLQAKLLRLLDSGEIIPVGASRPITVKLRLIGATNRDLATEVREGRFREDLYYRLSVVHIVVPPLRHRRADIPGLVEVLIRKLNLRLGTSLRGVQPEVMQAFLTYLWPGNVRELANVLERACCLGATDRVALDDLPEDIAMFLTPSDGADALPADRRWSLHAAMALAEREHLRAALVEVGGDRRKAAELLGIGLTSIYRKIEQHKLATEPPPAASS